MSGKLKGWFSGLSKAGKVTALLVTGGVLIGGIGAVASPCDGVTTYANKTINEPSSFDTKSTKDPNLNVGQIQIQKPGIDGKNQVTYKIGTKCEKQVSKQAIKTVVISKPVSQEQTEGSKEVSTETQDIPIAYGSQSVSDPTMDKGTTKIVQTGINGSKKVTFEVVKIDGKEKSRTQKSESITLQPVNQITNVGTKSNNCDPNYTPCIPYYSGNALNCPDVGIQVRVIGVDHNRLDGDGDGYGCESY